MNFRFSATVELKLMVDIINLWGKRIIPVYVAIISIGCDNFVLIKVIAQHH